VQEGDADEQTYLNRRMACVTSDLLACIQQTRLSVYVYDEQVGATNSSHTSDSKAPLCFRAAENCHTMGSVA
jgi:hypothetical protein